MLEKIFSYLRNNYKHIHNPYKVYPTLASGVQLTASTTAWELGSITEIIPAGVVPEDFDIHEVKPEAIDSTEVYEIVLYEGPSGSEVELGRCRISNNTNVSSKTPSLITSKVIEYGTRISGAVATGSSNSDTITVSLAYHEY